MKLSKISIEDPILTAYALGELDAAAAERVAAAISHDAAALQVVNEIRSTAGDLHAVLKDEPILSERTTPMIEAKSATIIPFPVYAATAAAAACVAAVFVLRASHPTTSAGVVPAATPIAVKAIVPTDADVAASSRIAKVIPDGFSDLKPAPFRDSGYRLGKSIAASDAQNTISESDTASASKILPAPANSPSTSAVASNEENTPSQLLSLKASPQIPVIDVAKSAIPFVNPRAFAFSNQKVQFTGLPDYHNLLKEAPRGSTYEEVLSWSTQDLEKKDQAEHRNDVPELVKRQKEATVE